MATGGRDNVLSIASEFVYRAFIIPNTALLPSFLLLSTYTRIFFSTLRSCPLDLDTVPTRIIIIIIYLFIYLNCKWGFTRGCGTTIRHNKQITHIIQNNTQHSNRNTAHKTTQTIKDALYTMYFSNIILNILSYSLHAGNIGCRSQCRRGIRNEPSSPSRTLGLWVLIPLEA
jgi:hypothetical protein